MKRSLFIFALIFSLASISEAQWVKGFAFRNNSGFCGSDPANATWFRPADAGGGDSYPTTRNSVTFGSLDNNISNREDSAVGLCSAGLAGRSYMDNNAATPRSLQFDLTATGDYDVVLSSSSPLFGQDNPLIRIYDNTTLLATLVNQTGNYPSTNFIDANNVVHTSSANWIANNTPKRLTFSTTTAVVKVGRGDGVTSGATSIGFIQFTQVTATPTPTPTALARKGQVCSTAIKGQCLQ